MAQAKLVGGVRSLDDQRGARRCEPRGAVRTVIDWEAMDFFRDDGLVADPYPYFDALRGQCPVRREPHHGVVMVTGYDEAVQVFQDSGTFSSCISVTGPFPGFPVPLEGGDVTALIEAHRDQLPMSDQLPTLDPPVHTAHRALLMKLITPRRLKENEASMWTLADRLLDEFLAGDEGEFISGFAARFTAYVQDRRREPRGDVLTGLATATFPDGSVPDVADVVRIAANLFSAGQETTVRLLSSAVKVIAERPAIQRRLREERDLIPNFIEEALRTESPVKGDFRLARVPAAVGGVDLPAGTTVMVLNGAANRDPRRFADPAAFDAARANARHHLAFGRGIHTCPGAPLARAEARVAIERILDRTAAITISERAHGPADARRYRYLPTFILRGLTRLHLEFTPAGEQPR